jgi:tRNA threonylcarbamoyladenosine modification (KEOPS) complex Cgi121 subunit
MLEKKKVNVVSYDHFIEGKENVLNTILEELNKSLEEEEEEKERIKQEKLEPKPRWNSFPRKSPKSGKNESPRN